MLRPFLKEFKNVLDLTVTRKSDRHLSVWLKDGLYGRIWGDFIATFQYFKVTYKKGGDRPFTQQLIVLGQQVVVLN